MIPFLNNIARSRAAVPATIGISIIMTLFTLGWGNDWLQSPQSDNGLWNALMHFNGILYGGVLINYLIVILGAWGIFKINEGYSLTHFRTNFPFILYLFYQVSNPNLQTLSIGTTAALFLLPVIALLFLTYQKEKATEPTFFAGVLLGILFLFWTKSILYLPVILLGFWMMRSLHLKVFFALLIGLLSMIWLQFTWLFLSDKLTLFVNQWAQLGQFQLIDFTSMTIGNIINLGVMGMIALLSSIYLLVSNFQEKVRIQSAYNFLILLGLASAALVVTDGTQICGHLTIFYITSTFLSANIFTQVQTKVTAALFFLIIGGLFTSYVFNLWIN